MSDERTILPRHLSAELKDALNYARVVNVVGARQVGKTTLVRDILQTGRFITLDDETVLDAIENDPWGQLQRLTDETVGVPLIIDEAQRSRNLPLAIKRLVDSSNRKGQFVLTGSSNIFSTRHVAGLPRRSHGGAHAMAVDRRGNPLPRPDQSPRLGCLC